MGAEDRRKRRDAMRRERLSRNESSETAERRGPEVEAGEAKPSPRRSRVRREVSADTSRAQGEPPRKASSAAVRPEKPRVRSEKSPSVPLEALAMPYATFVCCNPGAEAANFSVVKDTLGIFAERTPMGYGDFLNTFREKHVPEADGEEYMAKFALKSLMSGEDRLTSYAFLSDLGRLRQDVYTFKTSEGAALFIGFATEDDPQEGGALMLRENAQSLQNKIADMQIEMQFERKEMKSHSRRVVVLFTLLALILGCVGGAVWDRQGGFFTNVLNQFFTKTEEAPEQEEVEVTPEATVTPVEPQYVSRLDTATFTAEISSNGTARTSTTITDYDTGTFTAGITDVLGPDDFASKYTKYTLDGTEACVALKLDFESIKDEDLTVIPQDAFQISMIGSDGERVEEYQLMDKEIAGSYAVSITDGNKKTFYKRYKYSDDIDYLVLSYYKDGSRSDYYFALKYDDPNVTHEELKSGDRKTMVTYLKTKLKALGYYSGTINTSFDSATVDAVKSAQADLGMEETGVADNAFQQALYAK